jgi:uncharacterized protein (TIGR03437 family)
MVEFSQTRKSRKIIYRSLHANFRFIASCFFLVFSAGSSFAQINVLTANYGNERTNANLRETHLTSANVAPGLFGKITEFPVVGSIYSQPLMVSGVTLPNGEVRNLLYVSTMGNNVYAFDANATSPEPPVWKVNLGAPVPSSLIYPTYSDVGTECGILSTGVIDPARQALYLVSESLEANSPVFRLHALDLATGAEKLHGPVPIVAAVDTPANGRLQLDPTRHIQRPGLLLANGVLYIAFGSVADRRPFQGWVTAFDATDLTHQLASFTSSSTAQGSGIWQSGRGLAADSSGGIYAITGDGEYDGKANFGESFLKFSSSGLNLVDWFTPADWRTMGDLDGDLSAGPAIIPGTHSIFGADKFGYVYLINGDSMGRLASGESSGAKSFRAVTTQGLIFNFALWPRGANTYVYLRGSKDSLKCYRISGGDIAQTPVSAGSNVSDTSRVGLTLSANGTQAGTGIVWETAGGPASPGTLHAFDASNLSVEIWNSDMDSRDTLGAFTKFVGPTVANGRVYVPTSADKLVVYGLLPREGEELPQIFGAGNAASYQQDSIAPGELITLFGSGLGPAAPASLTVDAFGLATTSLASTRVLFDGVPVPVTYSSDSQVSVVAPFGLAGPSTSVSVEYLGVASDSISLFVTPSAPGIFSADGSGSGQALAINEDGYQNTIANPAPAGSVVTLYATGAGQTSPPGQDGAIVDAAALPFVSQKVTALIDGQPADVLYAGGAPGIVSGVSQINLRIPAGAAAGNLPIVLNIGGRTSQTGLAVAVKRPAAP